MKVRKPEVEIIRTTPNPIGVIEFAARTCYQSEPKEHSFESSKKFVRKVMNRGHEAVIEHASMTMKFVCDRGVTHEFVRHRLFSYCQESTRYCNYGDKEMEFIEPAWLVGAFERDVWDEDQVDTLMDTNPADPRNIWIVAMKGAELQYKCLLEKGWTPQQARSVLPNSLKTEIIVSGNMREWLHFFRLRTATAAHPDMARLATISLGLAAKQIPVIFDEFTEAE